MLFGTVVVRKVSGPDGFTFKLIKSHWEVIKSGIMVFIKHLETGRCLA